MMVVPGKLVIDEDFSKDVAELPKGDWVRRQGTRWAFEGGVLKGRPSTAEYQAARSHHKGTEARLSLPRTPADFAASFRFRFVGGKETPIVPFVEFGHHVCRLRFSSEGTELLAEGESLRLAKATGLRFEPGKWYEVFTEMKGGEFVAQFEGGVIFYGRHASFAVPPKSGGNGIGFAGATGGNVEVDDLKVWEVKKAYKAGWDARRSAFPGFEPQKIEKKWQGKK